MYIGLSLWRVCGWLSFGLFLWIAAAAHAQDLRGSLLVTAEDSSGGRIADTIGGIPFAAQLGVKLTF